MRWLLILPIRVYRLIPAGFKRRCLFRETCSVFVMRAAAEGGLLMGCRAFTQRHARCRPQFSVCYDDAARDWKVVFADGTVACSAEMADFVVEPYLTATAQAQAVIYGAGASRS